MNGFFAKALAAAMLSLLLIVSASAEVSSVGRKMPDFAYTAIDGTEITLSGLLERYDAVYVNFFFESCYWCGMEFPVLEAAWENHQEHIAVVAIDPVDGPEGLPAFAKELGLKFTVVSDEDSVLAEQFNLQGYPTSFLVNKEGIICWTESGAITNPAAYEAMFSDCETKTPAQLVGYKIPPVDPIYPAQDPAALSAALGGDPAFTWESGGSDTMAGFTPGAENEGASFHTGETEGCLAMITGIFNAADGDTLSFRTTLLADGLTEDNGAFMFSVNDTAGTVHVGSDYITEGEKDWSFTIEKGGEYALYILMQTSGLESDITLSDVSLTHAD